MATSIVTIYTDGSCIRAYGNTQRRAGAGVYSPERPDLSRSMPLSQLETTNHAYTNQRAELHALIIGLNLIFQEKAKRSHDSKCIFFELYSDARSAINLITTQGPAFRRRYGEDFNNWVNSKHQPVANADLINQAMEIYRKINRLFPGSFALLHCYGHSGNIGNEEADRLAKKACECCQVCHVTGAVSSIFRRRASDYSAAMSEQNAHQAICVAEMPTTSDCDQVESERSAPGQRVLDQVVPVVEETVDNRDNAPNGERTYSLFGTLWQALKLSWRTLCKCTSTCLFAMIWQSWDKFQDCIE
ncbi:uncharacterized protein LODBEIA_P24000 [Lodderomyces beijingensis]|uniref:ribonuclease H n=1 Tax=Lodderomyces beijingensis TaxID=1775926 RepID=A0ABP0ZMQ8_9ASCO